MSPPIWRSVGVVLNASYLWKRVARLWIKASHAQSGAREFVGKEDLSKRVAAPLQRE